MVTGVQTCALPICITTDKIPFIGQYAAERPDWFVATGFRKWGMSSAMVSAMLLRDQICGIENPYAEVFSPARFSAEEIPQMMKDGGKAVKGLTKRFFHLPEETAAALERGHGAVVETSEGKAAVSSGWSLWDSMMRLSWTTPFMTLSRQASTRSYL